MKKDQEFDYEYLKYVIADCCLTKGIIKGLNKDLIANKYSKEFNLRGHCFPWIKNCFEFELNTPNGIKIYKLKITEA